MSEKYLKEIAKELNLIRKELQKSNKPEIVKIDGEKVASALADDLKKRVIRQSDD